MTSTWYHDPDDNYDAIEIVVTPNGSESEQVKELEALFQYCTFWLDYVVHENARSGRPCEKERNEIKRRIQEYNTKYNRQLEIEL